ncbi:MAG: serine hydrolase domain-containing protein [Pseudoxanthomonas sp.]
MKKWLLCLALLASPIPVVAAGASAERADFDAAVEQAFARYRLPGLAVGVIEDGRVVYTRTLGERETGSGEKIDTDTLFAIASNSKAMLTGVLARLVDQGRLQWNDPVTQYLPNFRMYDPWVTRNMQVRDLLTHSSGLGQGAGDLMLWPQPNAFTRADVIAGLAYLKPATSFRAHYAYDNLLYVVAGEVAAAAGGKPYAELVREQLFAPLHMDRCQAGRWNRAQVGNVATPHRRTPDGNQPLPQPAIVPDETMLAAGGIRCSLDDMLKWAGMWLDPDSRWISAEQRRALWSEQMPMPISPRMRAWDHTHFYAYGYGWRLSDVDGVWRVAHTGTLDGMYSSLILLPDKRVAIVILANGEGEAMRTVLGEVLTKHYTAPQERATVAHYAELLDAEQGAAAAHSRAPDTSARVAVRPAELAGLLGVYRDPWFGQVAVCAAGDRVAVHARKSPRLAGTLMRVGARRLIAWDGGDEAEAWADFAPAHAGAPASLRLALVDPDADFSYDYQDLHFTRTGNCDGP